MDKLRGITPQPFSLDGPDKATKIKQAEKAAEEFEALLAQQMVKSMWQNVSGVEVSREESLYRDMLTEEFGRSLAKSGELGIKKVIYEDIKRKDFKDPKGQS